VTFHVSLVGRHNLSNEIYQQLRAAIQEGRLEPGARLPPSRELAESLAVARMTVTVAYERLAGDGYVEARVGSGTFVRADLRFVRDRRRRPTATAPRVRRMWRVLADTAAVKDPVTAEMPRFDFRAGFVDAELFPHHVWRRLLLRDFEDSKDHAGAYAAPGGSPRLREAIARHLAVTRAVQATAENIIVTDGTQQSLDLLARALAGPRDRVAVESPGYSLARLLFRSHGLRVTGVPVDDEGIVVTGIPSDARLVYVTPSHQFPMGTTMSLPRRIALSEWARKNHGAIIEDDYDSEFQFGGRPIEPLQSLNVEHVIYVGSFSKVTLPTVRLGFMVTPPSLTEAVTVAKFVSNWHTSLQLQGAMARFLDEGHFGRHVRRVRASYRERRALILATLVRDFPEFRVIPSNIGLHVSAVTRIGEPVLRRAVARARSAGVGIHALSRYSVPKEHTRKGLVVGYGAIHLDRIEEGLAIVRRCLDQEVGG
jgi:GntR family transcriptional regulator/MocR family aminotransferase